MPRFMRHFSAAAIGLCLSLAGGGAFAQAVTPGPAAVPGAPAGGDPAGVLVGPAGVSRPAPTANVPPGFINDYPTVARADYVFGCMAANGQSRPALEKCSCSIDTIATILPYEKYVEAETILSVGQVAGQQAEIFRSTGMFRDMVADLRRAQAEAEVTCFY
ncbi:hypothetical protein KHC19_17740 [Ancylobacter oerskovii]|nr:hypothetical protein [Ancylobacter oerskovii]